MSVKGLSKGGLSKSFMLLCGGLFLFCALPAFSQPQTERAAAPRFSTSAWAMQVFKSLELEHVNTEGGLEQHLYVNRKILSCQGGACNCEFNKRSVRVEHLGAVLDVGGEYPNIEALCKLDGTPMESLFGGVDLQTLPPGELDIISLNPVQQGTEFEAEDEVCFPFPTCDTHDYAVSNPHETDAIVVPHGYSLHWLWAAKGNTGPIPAEMTQFIGDYVDENNIADFPKGNKELIVIYDLDTSNGNGLQYGDAAIKLESCTDFDVPPPPEEVHLRLGGGGETPTCYEEQDPGCTDGHRGFTNIGTMGGSYGAVGIRVKIVEATVITGLNGVGGSTNPFWTGGYTLKLNVHSSEQHFADNPFDGDVLSAYDVSLINDPPELYGGESSIGFPWYYLTFGFEPFILSPDEDDYIISLEVDSPKDFSFAETSTILIDPDIWTANHMQGSWVDLDGEPGATTGTVAVDVKSYFLP